MKKLSAVAGLSFIILSPWLGHSVRASATQNTSSKRVDALHIEQFGVYNALAEISQKAHIAVGVEAIQSKESTIAFDFPGGTVADLLNMLVSRAPDYSWEENDHGIVHAFRINGRVSLLDVSMSYPGAKKKTRKEIWGDIAKRPEVSKWMNSNGCIRGELLNGKEFRDHNDPISIVGGPMTVEQLLDEVAVKSGVNYWAVLQSGSNQPCRVDVILW